MNPSNPSDRPSSLQERLHLCYGELPWSGEDILPIEHLLDLLQRGSWANRITAARTLEALGPSQSEQVTPALIQALADPAHEVRVAVVHALDQLEDKAPREALLPLLTDPEWSVRASVVGALGRMQGEAPIDTIIHIAEEDPDAAVRKSAIWALGTVPLSSIPRVLRRALYDPDPFIRWEAVWTFGEQRKLISQQEFLVIMKHASADEDENVRQIATDITQKKEKEDAR